MAMNVVVKPTRMTVEEFHDWVRASPSRPRHELRDGIPYAMMSPERARHVRAKHRVCVALEQATSSSALEVLGDGMSIRIDDWTVYEPDACVSAVPVPDDAVFVTEPLLVAEVLSPATGPVDTGLKLADYFRVATTSDYLVIDALRRVVIHHRRAAGGPIETRVASDGELILGIGVRLSVKAIFAPRA
jgi:Uma2 family endonuclease